MNTATAALRVDTALGPFTITAGEAGLLSARFDAPDVDLPANALCRRAAAQLTDYLAGRQVRFDVPLAPQGTAFQRAVWARLRTLAPGETTDYGTLAASLGRPRAARAVGAAVGRNPLWIFIPCHRVIGRDGSLTGYAGGLARKQALLTLEGADARA